ncbi:apoptosis-enhancing nuclease-like [Conger conger]|uniref:apoptosis-enhancing nuclease-like n=1 Tax=Conger conger TaxID=82655 RepID=UPI002A59EC1E|nr:apoptosis-enhancing nuclease-like [Conger conger]XP_061078311.1 apoptosis-enhancing nuclease-like [Conger conger]XP_061078312.1 apoptosis-enhancing nuclease-like [Conger conger]
MKRPGVSDRGGTGSGGEMLRQSPSPVSQSTTCHFVSPSLEAEAHGTKGHTMKRTPSKIQRVERRKAALRKMAALKRKRRGLCLMLRGQGDTGPGTEPHRAGKGEWELDSGFSSEVSSGRSSPCAAIGPAQLVAMDCEMVGTGQDARCSELARCSLVNYHGEVLYDQYIQPQQPVTDYRTRWSGICQHHLLHAVPFQQAREEILQILQGKVVVGHALHNDFRALGFIPPRHMIRDTCCTRLLRQLSGMPAGRSISLKNLAKTLLNRDIQMGRVGHSSVEDAVAAMDLYKLVEGQWEQDVLNKTQNLDVFLSPVSDSSHSHYMQDQYWPADLTED